MIAVIVLFVVSIFAGYFIPSTGRGQPEDYAVAEVDGKDVMRSDIEKGTMQLAEQLGSERRSVCGYPVYEKGHS